MGEQSRVSPWAPVADLEAELEALQQKQTAMKAELSQRRKNLVELQQKKQRVLKAQIRRAAASSSRGPSAGRARVGDPTVLKAELRIAETQAKDVQIEVLEGLEPDDQVVLSDMSALGRVRPCPPRLRERKD